MTLSSEFGAWAGRPALPHIVHSAAEEDTERAARELAPGLEAGDIVLLHGELAAGKSVFARALIHELGVRDRGTRPTFPIVCEYIGRAPILHVDLYRIGSEAEAIDLGIEDAMAQAITIVEWPQRWPALASRATLHIRIAVTGQQSRTIEIAAGARALGARFA